MSLALFAFGCDSFGGGTASLCPHSPDLDSADFFPLQERSVWTFDHTYEVSRRGSGTPYEGTLLWTFDSVRCVDNQRIATISTSFFGTQRGLPYSTTGSLTVIESEANEVSFMTSDLTEFEESTFVVPRYSAEPSDTLEIRSFPGTVCLVRGVGPVDVRELRRYPLGGRFESTLFRR